MQSEFQDFRNCLTLSLLLASWLGPFDSYALSETYSRASKDNLLGSRVELKSKWVGANPVPKSLPILVLAGHADSQGLAGAGTAGEAVDLQGEKPMDKTISDELFWNLRIRDAVVELGKAKGLNITSYEPGIRNIVDGNDPRTNWSAGARHIRKGGYAFEIHFDSYGQYGYGSGIIPALSLDLNTLDESFAKSFGRYPLFFRGGLGGPRRGIRILEVGKLEGYLEESLRDKISRKKTIDAIARRIVNALIDGLQSKQNY